MNIISSYDDYATENDDYVSDYDNIDNDNYATDYGNIDNDDYATDYDNIDNVEIIMCSYLSKAESVFK